MQNNSDNFDLDKLLSALNATQRTIAAADAAVTINKNVNSNDKSNHHIVCYIVCSFFCIFCACTVVISDKQLSMANEKLEVYRELQNTKSLDLQREISILRGRVDVLRAQVDKQ